MALMWMVVDRRWCALTAVVLFLFGLIVLSTADASEIPPASAESPNAAAPGPWEVGVFVDGAYAVNTNFPHNHKFRNRTTTATANEFDLNMAGISFKKEAEAASRWGGELLVHGGEDSRNFGFSTYSPNVGSSDQLRHFGRANVSYLAPVGEGLKIQAGLFNSLIGYESLYSKDNSNYSRSWIADYSPYLMFGVNASYPLTQHLTGTVFVINEYWHLAHANNQPSYGAQLAWNGASRLSLQQTVYFGPDQSDTDMKFWRLFSDSIAKWQDGPFTVAFDYQIGSERLAAAPGNPRVFWTGASLPMRWNVSGPWSVAVRPEFYWDRSGRLTGSEQLVRAVTTTLEHRLPVHRSEVILRFEYRFDESTGQQGGFFNRRSEAVAGPLELSTAQHLFIFSAVWTFSTRL